MCFDRSMVYISSFECVSKKKSDFTDMALDISRKRLYILDSGAKRVLIYTLTGEQLGVLNNDPESWQYIEDPSSIAINPLGFVYIGSDSSSVLARYNPDGSFSAKQDVNLFKNVAGMCATGDTIIIIDGSSYEIKLIDYSGWCRLVFGGNSKKGGTIGKARRVVASNDFIYVLDPYYRNVHKYSYSGEELIQMGDKGKEPGKFIEPIDLAVDKKDNVYILDQNLKRVSIFNKEGRFVNAFESNAEDSVQMSRPTEITVSPDGKIIYIYDSKLYAIIKYNAEGVMQSYFGKKGKRDIGEFYSVSYMGLDESRFLFVAEPHYNRIQKIDFTGASGVGYAYFYKDTQVFESAKLYTIDEYGRLILNDTSGKIVLLR